MKKSLLPKNCNDFCLYHAINLKDYINYMGMGGIANRQQLISFAKNKGGPNNYTVFWTDKMDAENGYLTRTFANIYDFNCLFWQSYGLKYFSPCVYGPITIEIAPSIWKDNNLSDVEFTDKTVGSKTPGRKLPPKKIELLDPRKYSATEVNMDIPIIFFSHFQKIIIDPIVINNKSLFDLVKAATPIKLHSRLTIRNSSEEANNNFQSIIHDLEKDEEKYEKKLNEVTRKSFKCWKKYFCDGTLPFFK